jgi:putative hemolysin
MTAEPAFRVKLAETESDLRAAQALRYRVFVQELGGDGEMVDHALGLERDKFDPYFDHLLLIDDKKNSAVVGVYRLLRDDQAQQAGQFYSEDEYDLSVLKSSGRRLMELGRSCLEAPYRGGAAMFHLWQGVARYVIENEIEILFGVASFHGTDTRELAQPLSMLHHNHLAPEVLRVRAKSSSFQNMNMISRDKLNRPAAMKQVPALIKAYLRLGGYVGEGAFVDHVFNTTDVCLVMDAARMSEKQKNIYLRDVTP